MSKILLVLPSATLDWEVWRVARAGREPGYERAVADAALAGEEPLVVGLGAGQMLVLSLWLTTRDATLFNGLILSQLEKRGLVPKGGMGAMGPVFDFRVVAEEESRTLVRVALLPPQFPENLSLRQAVAYTSAGDLLPLPENRLVLRVERHNLVLAVTRGEEMVFEQVVTRTPEVTAALAAELNVVIRAVEAEHLVRKVAGITVWHAPGALIAGVECLEGLGGLGLPVEVAERPGPALSRVEQARARGGVVPLSLQAIRRAEQRRRQRMRLGVLAAVVYVGVVFLMWAFQLKLKREAAALGELVAQDKPAAATLEKTAAAWRTLEPAVDARYYALEQFYQAVSALPPVGMRFNSFEIKNDLMIIRGMARNAPEVFRYVEALKQQRELPTYHWRAGQPRVLNDDTAEFKIEGKRF